ncbi:hypothetical protein M2337_002403 [Sphingobium sp. B2D3A]|uniref:hypothetical protein n=1 Tax=unclassified Sphingobium TaxID=2611147 RepID=UPI002225B5F8|nr:MULTISPECIES: hypothetical protein [unclassified Sphingobium]MCW2338170.1 hypothetical protein [Sphingobium sp. B2D3A]MCW2384629.1 hypothetical protein [Sphingobium sp. B2D3D]
MRAQPFTRPTLLAAVEMLERHTQASFDQMTLRLGLENEVSEGSGISVAKKVGQLGRIVVQRSGTVLQTVQGSMTLGEAVVRETLPLLTPRFENPNQTALLRGLARDGYVVEFDDRGKSPQLRAALPEEVDLPASDSEVHELLKQYQFQVPKGHLDQAIEAHTRGDWAACNAQLRTFLESLFDQLAHRIAPAKAAALASSENRRALLASEGFLVSDRNEWTQDGKNFVNGLFKMLHTDGSHPGLSDEDHSTFRLHLVLVTARTFLRRFHNGT